MAPLASILENDLTDTCQADQALTVNVFVSEEALLSYLQRSRLPVTTTWQRAGKFEGRRFGNLLVARQLSDACFSRTAVEHALESFG